MQIFGRNEPQQLLGTKIQDVLKKEIIWIKRELHFDANGTYS